MKTRLLVLLICLIALYAQAQKKPVTEKAVEASEKVNKKAQQINEASNKIAVQAEQVGENVKNIAENVKKVIKVFEPIFSLHFKRNGKNKSATGQGSTVVNASETKSDNKTNGGNDLPPPPDPPVINNSSGNSSMPASPQLPYDAGIPESTNYNSDGTANWGNQYNAEYGCYLDALTGTILDGGQAEDSPLSVDLIFLAPNDGQNAYYLITPNFAHDNGSADAFWGSATTDNPVRSWESVNESEVAVTTLTGLQFEKIQYNEQLRGVVKGARGFASFFISLNKLDGKIFAVKTTMGGRDAFALIYVVKQVGTSGSGGYLKVKIKCTGFDNNGDGSADPNLYQPRQ